VVASEPATPEYKPSASSSASASPTGAGVGSAAAALTSGDGSAETSGGAPAATKKEEPEESCDPDLTGGSTAPTGPRVGFSGDMPALGDLTKPQGDGLGFGISMAKIDRDIYAIATLSTTLSFGKLKLGVQAPLRFPVYNLDTKESSLKLREDDWDEISDWLRILRFVEYGHPKDTFYGRFGELTATTLGHGTLVNGYFNSIDIDHYQAGLRLNVNTNPGGVETMLNSITSPHLVGGRAYLRPWYFVNRCSALCRFAIGASVFAATSAPTSLDGAGVNHDTHTRTDVPSRSLVLYGVDVEYTLLSNPVVDVTPYADLNFISGLDSGMHAGVLFGVHLLAADLQARLEYRRLGAKYLPGYFDSMYEAQRFVYVPERTKLQWLEQGGNGKAINGYYGEMEVNVLGQLSLLGGYEDYEGEYNSAVHLRLQAPEIFGLRLGAYYTKRNFDQAKEIFERDNALGILEARYAVNSFFSIVGAVARQWRLGESGDYEVIDTWNVGTSFGLTF